MQYKIAKKLYNLFDLQDTVGLCLFVKSFRISRAN